MTTADLETRSRTTAAVQKIARFCQERAEGLGMTGTRRDAMTLDFFCGALAVAYALDDAALAMHLEKVGSWVIAPRGYAGLDILLKD